MLNSWTASRSMLPNEHDETDGSMATIAKQITDICGT